MPGPDRPVVLIVEDEPAVAETYERWLAGGYEVRRAGGGEEALTMLGDEIDVVLLDRLMPDKSGEDVLAEIRGRGIDCRVAMVTAVDPDLDIVDMGFDAYVTKPPRREELEETIERLLERAGLDEAFQRYYSLVARRAALETSLTERERAESEEYADLLDRIKRQRAALDETIGEFGSDVEFVGTVRDALAEDPAPPSGGS